MKASFNLWLVALSVGIAIVASYVAVTQARRSGRKAMPGLFSSEVLGAAISMGTGVWTMHFIGMMALHLPYTLSYDFGLTALSYLLVLLGSAAAFYSARACRRDASKPLLPSVLLMSTGVVGMHYTGMEALQLSPAITYDSVLFLLSLAVGFIASYVGLKLAFRASFLYDRFTVLALASIVMGLAVSGMHYLSILAANFSVDAHSAAGLHRLGFEDLTLLVVSGFFLVITLSLLSSLARPLFFFWQMVTLIIFGEFAVMILLDQFLKDLGEFGWLRNFIDGILLTLFLSPVLWRLRRDNASLVYERARASTALASIGDGVVVTDPWGGIEYLNEVAESLIGTQLAEVKGKPLADVFNPLNENGNPGVDAIAECVRQNKIINSEERLVLKRKDGSLFGIEETASPIRDEDGETAGVVLVFRDVTLKQRAEDELNLSASVFSHAVEGIIITDHTGRILRVNRAFCNITGFLQEEVLGKNPRLLSSGRHDRAFYQGMWERLVSSGEWQGEVWNRRKNGEVYPEWLSIRAIFSEKGDKTHYVGIFSDISERIRDQEYIFRLAYYDSLTSVANRALLMDHLEMAIAQAHRHQMAVAVLFIDMDRFKLINDSLGHSVGDLLLQNVAQAITSSVRDGDTVSRFGGDEFVICLPDISGDRSEAARDSLRVAEKIQRRLSQTFLLQGHEVAVTPSIGVAIYPWDGETPGVLIKHADTAMYHAKSQGRDNVQLFFEEMLSSGSERLHIQGALRKALENHEFLLHYQAQIDLDTGQIVGGEALLRWSNPELGWTSPSKFIPVAEDNSLILPIGDWVLRQACSDWMLWKELLGPEINPPRIAINFSPRQFIQPDFVGRIMRVLDETGICPDFLEIEITEATLMHNTQMALNALNQLRDKGIRVAVDDFGVGYSSLSYLKKFPIDVLKIDQSFIRDISTDSNDAQIVRAIIAMGRSLNLRVLAEGVETQEQLEFLRNEGCEEVQGYLLSLPVPAAEFVELLREGANLLRIAAPE